MTSNHAFVQEAQELCLTEKVSMPILESKAHKTEEKQDRNTVSHSMNKRKMDKMKRDNSTNRDSGKKSH